MHVAHIRYFCTEDMKRLICIIIIFLAGKSVFTQESGLSVYGGWGFTVPHHAEMWNYIEKHGKQIDLTYFSDMHPDLPSGSNLRKALGFSFLDPVNPDIMVYGLSLYPQLHFPFNAEKRNSWFILGCGVEYNTKKYSDINYRFNSIGSHFNAFILLGFTREFKISDDWRISARFNWSHYSNGATKDPNYGLNIPTAGISIQKYFKPKKENAKSLHIYDNPNWQFLASGSMKQLRIEGPVYSTYMFSAEKNISPKKRNYWSLGSDLIFDQSMQDLLTDIGDSSTNFSDNIKITLKGAWNVPLENLHISLQAGIYLKNAYFREEYLFQRLALRYRFTEQLGASISMRSHYAVADVIELGLMYTLQ
mgnify:CR=1 FL=1